MSEVRADLLPWHHALLTEVSAAHEQDRLAHAIGITAPTGWGLVEAVEGVVRALLELEHNQPIAEIAHPDLKWVEPDGVVLKIDQIRSVCEYAVQTPQIAKLKVCVLVRADLLNVEAANALLKTLEEPPANTLLILCSENWGRLLPTVRSRCQRVRMSCLQGEAIAWLQAQGCEVAERDFALAGYAPLTALAQHQQGFDQWIAQVSAQGIAAAQKSSLPDELAPWLALWYRHVIQRMQEELAGDPDTASLHYLEQIHGFSEELLSVRRQILSRNFATQHLLIERLAFLWHNLHRQPRV